MALCLAAILYASVGHGGATAYLAIFALSGMVEPSLRPWVLSLNCVVASQAAWRFTRAGHMNWSVAWPWLVAAIPMAFLGGHFKLANGIYQGVLGLAIACSALLLWLPVKEATKAQLPSKQPIAVALLVGAALGLLAGITGIGGGVFLSPVLLLAGFAKTKEAAAIAAWFILLNSLAGLAAQSNLLALWSRPEVQFSALAVLFGGSIGAYFGARRFSSRWLRRLLAVVLIIAAVKLFFEALGYG